MKAINANDFYDDLKKSAGKSFTISRINSIETLNDIKEAFAKAMKDGYDPKKLKEVIQQVAESRGDTALNPSHLSTVLRTNIQTAFSKGRLEAQRESGNEVFQYLAVLDGRETELCNELDGKFFNANDDFWNTYYPPNHFNCRSTVISMGKEEVKGDIIERGKEYLEGTDLKDINPGEGFQYQPGELLNKHLQEKTSELGIDNVKESDPVTKSENEKEFIDKLM